MTDRRDGRDDPTGAPTDFDRLDAIATRLSGDDRFEGVDVKPPVAPNRVVCTYDPGLYPGSVRRASLEVAWFENDDFSVQYHEDHVNGAFDHRWDRHPSDHNTRDHVHPGPDAPTPGVDATHPDDWRDVLSTVLAAIQTRQQAFWIE